MKLCVLATLDAEKEVHALGDDLVHCRTVEDLKKLNKNKKLVKKLAKKYDAFLASQSIIKLIPKLLPGLSRLGKFPTPIAAGESVKGKVEEIQKSVKFQVKKVLCLHTAIGHVEMTEEEIRANVYAATNLLVSLLKKKWQNIKVIYMKSSMGPPFQVFF